MKMSLYDKAPKCPKCKVPMKDEGTAYTEEQEQKENCEHEWGKGKEKRDEGETYGTRDDVCKKCGETRSFLIKYTGYDGGEIEPEFEEMRFIRIPSARLVRCPKCYNVYKIEGGD